MIQLYIRAANNKTDTETGTAQVLFNGQRRSRNLIRKSTSQPNPSRATKSIRGRVEVKGRELERVGGIFMRYLRTGVWFGPGNVASLLFSPCMGFSGCCHSNCQLSRGWWVCHLANVLQ